MPNNPEHCEDSLKRYGKSFSELHTWMDEPSAILAGSHRKYRHDPNTTPREAKAIFGENADHACLDHIRLDELDNRRKGISRNTTVTNEPTIPFIPLLSGASILVFLLMGFMTTQGMGMSIVYYAIAFVSFLVFVVSLTQFTPKELMTESPIEQPTEKPAWWMMQPAKMCSKCGANFFLSQHEKCPFCGEPLES